MQKALTIFITMWLGFAAILALLDIATIVVTAPSIWSGIWAAQEKWFWPNWFAGLTIPAAVFSIADEVIE
jgi:hypothetical protein